MSKDNFQTLLDGIDTGKSTVLDVCKKYNEQEISPVITDEQFAEHSFFTKHLSAELCKILTYWASEGKLDDNQREIFQVGAQLLFKLTKTIPKARQWLNQQAELIESTSKCLNEIASNGYYIAVNGVEDPNLESFDYLIQAFENAKCYQTQLMDLLVKTVTSGFYIDALQLINEKDQSSPTITQRFLLISCPDYILQCDNSKEYSLQITNKMLYSYDDIFNDLLPQIAEWSKAFILALTYPMQFILISIRKLTFEQRKYIFPIPLEILLNKSTQDPNIGEAGPLFISTALSVLIEITRSDKNLANELKNKSEKKEDLLKILNKLSKDDENDKIQLKALALKSLLISESDFFKEHKTEDVIKLFLKNFDQALHQEKEREIVNVLREIKDFLQNDDIKQEIVKQNGLTPLLQYAQEAESDPLVLEVVYAMTFNEEAKKKMNEHNEFIDSLKLLKNSENKKLAKMTHGILWKLDEEEKFKNRDTTSKQTPSEKSDDKPDEKFDMMISYCWAQKELCHKLNDRLEKDGFNVWLDRDEMHGSIIESMANAIEKSRFVLICMSSNYKNSINCKAEAEYAFNRKSKIIPLIVEPKYIADGWLGFLSGSKIYVDFADKEDEEFEKAYELLIAELERNGLHELDDEKSKKTLPSTTEETKSETQTETDSKKEPEKEIEEEPKPPPVLTREYLNVGIAPLWTDVHVNEFLTDHKLDEMKSICEQMDGETLVQFYETCLAMPDKMYQLVNNTKEKQPVSLNIFFKFIGKFKKFLPPSQPRVFYFQYYPPQKSSKEMNK